MPPVRWLETPQVFHSVTLGYRDDDFFKKQNHTFSLGSERCITIVLNEIKNKLPEKIIALGTVI